MIASMTASLGEIATWLGKVFTGPLGGLVGGAISFIVLEMGYKKRRERNGIAEALAAELSGIARELDGFIVNEDKQEVPIYFRTSHVLFDALADKLAVLQFEDVMTVTHIYHTLDELNRMPAAWRERASNALSRHPDDPVRKSELKTLEEGRVGFYDLATKVRIDCRGLATHLRTKYAIGWRSLIPLRLRPTLRVPSGNAAA
jgi:hypothetical protein